MTLIDVKAVACWQCDFSGGKRGMDNCAKCRGTGSGYFVHGRFFPFTEDGYREAVYAANHCEATAGDK